MLLDIRTLIICVLVFAVVFSLGMYLAQRSQPKLQGLRWWSAAFALTANSFLLFALRGEISDALSVMVGNALLVIALGLFLEGAMQVRGQPGRMSWLSPALLAVLLPVLAYYVYVRPDFQARIISASIVYAIPLAATSWVLVRDIPRHLRYSHWFTAAAFAQLSAMCLLRAGISVYAPPQALLESTPAQTVAFLSIFVMLILASFGCVWMVTESLSEQLERQARTDPLTGSMNRFALEDIVPVELARALRSGRPLSVLMFDLDRFKELNDRMGHQYGDMALQTVTELTRRVLRGGDHLARYGGEEFLAVLPDTGKNEAREIAERLRHAIESQGISIGQGATLTASYGVATFPEDGGDFHRLIGRADSALYRAKEEGRNRVVVA